MKSRRDEQRQQSELADMELCERRLIRPAFTWPAARQRWGERMADVLLPTGDELSEPSSASTESASNKNVLEEAKAGLPTLVEMLKSGTKLFNLQSQFFSDRRLGSFRVRMQPILVLSSNCHCSTDLAFTDVGLEQLDGWLNLLESHHTPVPSLPSPAAGRILFGIGMCLCDCNLLRPDFVCENRLILLVYFAVYVDELKQHVLMVTSHLHDGHFICCFPAGCNAR